MKPENIDELERLATYNLHALQKVRDRGDADTQLAKLFEQRMNDALESLGDYFKLASGVVTEITDDTA